MNRALACLAVVFLVGCSSVAEPEPEPVPLPPELAQADSVMAAMDREIMFVTAPGAGGPDSPACRTALRDYYIVATLYGIAVAAARISPNAVNVSTAVMMALALMNASTNVYNNCSSTRPA